jgi:hypothetical protein
MDEIVIYPSKFKTTLIAIGALSFAIAGIYLGFQGQELGLDICLLIVVSYLGTPFFTIVFIYSLYRLLKPTPAVVINQEGIFDNATAVGAGLLRWEEIAEVFLYEYQGQRMLGIKPVNLDEVLGRQPLLKRLLGRQSRRMVGAPFNIPETTLPVSAKELLDHIVAWHKHIQEKRSEAL